MPTVESELQAFRRARSTLRPPSPPTLLPAHSPTPTGEVELLRVTPRGERSSGFRNVYASGSGWVAKVKEGGRLRALPGSHSPQPHVAAAYVVAWYKARFGAHWQAALSRRKKPYWRISYVKKYKGWVITVWADGQAQLVTRPGGDAPLVCEKPEIARIVAMLWLPARATGWAAWRG